MTPPGKIPDEERPVPGAPSGEAKAPPAAAIGPSPDAIEDWVLKFLSGAGLSLEEVILRIRAAAKGDATKEALAQKAERFLREKVSTTIIDRLIKQTAPLLVDAAMTGKSYVGRHDASAQA